MAIIVDRVNTNITDGVWTEFEDSRFLVTSINNLKFQRALNRLNAPFRRKIENGTMDPGKSKDITCKAVCEGLVIDWKDVIDSKGEQVAFSKDMLEMALKNNDELRDYLVEFAMDLNNFRMEEVEELGKD